MQRIAPRQCLGIAPRSITLRAGGKVVFRFSNLHRRMSTWQGDVHPFRTSIVKDTQRIFVVTCASSNGDRTARLRNLLARPGILLGPAAYDGISAKLTEEAGFDFAFMSGFSVAGARVGMPDTGLLSYGEVLDQGRCMHEATTSIPIIGDGDTGYGNAMNVKRTVRGFASAGFAGILIEDQVWPKSCGHVRGKRVVSRKEAVARVRAACDARDQGGQDIVIVARTDARQAESFAEALWRASAFADAGADVVFIDALESVAEMRTLCVEVDNAAKMASLLEGGGKTPTSVTPKELEEMGFKLVAYPLSLLGVSIAAQREALAGLKTGRLPAAMPSFADLQKVLGFDAYFEEEGRYAVDGGPSIRDGTGTNTHGGGGGDGRASALEEDKQQNQKQQKQASSSSSAVLPGVGEDGVTTGEASTSAAPRVTAVEADAILEPGSTRNTAMDGQIDGDTVDIVSSMDGSSSSSSSSGQRGKDSAYRRNQWLRIRISDARTGAVKLDTRFPAGFLGNVAAIIPQVAGLDLEGLLKGSSDKGGKTSFENEPVLSFAADGDSIQVFLEDG